MIIKTESGSRYEIDDHGICRKFNSAGTAIDAFKVFYMKSVPTTVTSVGEVWDYPNCEPRVGMLLYIGGKDGWWLSTKIVSIDTSEMSPPRRFRDIGNGE